jgi:hypothetical protein
VKRRGFRGVRWLRTSDPHLPVEDIALGYKQLLEVERGWRDMKQVIDLRPVYHRKEERIRAHVILCWLALLLIRITEATSAGTWPGLRRELQRIALCTFTGPAGTFRQRTELSKTQHDILAQLKIEPPPKVYQLTTPSTLTSADITAVNTRPPGVNSTGLSWTVCVASSGSSWP